MSLSKQFLAGAAVLAVLFLLFYPQFWEVDYQSTIRTATWLWQGKFVEPDAQYAYYMWDTGHGYFAYPFEIGRTIISAPFVLVSWNAPFILGLLFHLLGAYYFYRILAFLGLDTRYSLLYLFFPPLTLLAGKFLLGDIASAALVSAASYYYLKGDSKGFLAAGIVLGISVWFRFTNVLILAGFLLAAALRSLDRAGPLAAGMIATAIPFFIATYLTIGTFWGYIYTAAANIGPGADIGEAASRATDYLIFLLIGFYPPVSVSLAFMLPLTLIAMLAAKTMRNELLLSAAASIAFFSLSGMLPNARYLLPLSAPMLLSMVPFLERAWFELGRITLIVSSQKAIYSIVLVFLALTAISLYVQSEKSAVRLGISREIYSFTPEGSLLVDIKGGHTSNFLFEGFGDRRLEVIPEEALLTDASDPCWLSANGGAGNIFVSTVTLYPRSSFSIREFMKADRVSIDIEPLADFLGKSGVKPSENLCAATA